MKVRISCLVGCAGKNLYQLWRRRGTDYPFTYQYSCPRKEPCCVGLVGNNLFSLVNRWNKINSKEPAASATEL